MRVPSVRVEAVEGDGAGGVEGDAALALSLTGGRGSDLGRGDGGGEGDEAGGDESPAGALHSVR